MCCCCPPAINALFCLWVRSGCSKASVAGALTFFPPDPPLYKFQRISASGETLPDDGLDDDDDDNDNGDPSSQSESESDHELMVNAESKNNKNKRNNSSSSSNSSNNKQDDATPSLSERSKMLKKRAKKRNARDKRDADAGVTYQIILDHRLRPLPLSFPGRIEAVKLLNKKRKSYIAALTFRRSNYRDVKTILYSHGNATDVGAMSTMQGIIALKLNVNVVVYDYSGYGESGGMALEKNTYSDIKTAYQYCLESLAGGVPEKVVVYGQSVGSGPSCYLCKEKPAGGLILHSPFTSGMRVLTPSRALACLDIFPNIERIKKVKCPVMVIHGMQDEEVDMAHGVALHENVPDQYKRNPWWVPDRGHNDICDGGGMIQEYLRRLETYLDSLEGDGEDGGGVEEKTMER